MKLIITIDTEEDGWDDYRTTGASLSNIERVPVLQALFDEFRVRPTYLITFPVATDEKSIGILRPVMETGRCEIGAHCHPWNTPPFEERINRKNTMLSNLPADLQYRKMRILDRAIQDGFGMKPVSFRCGRWGYNADVAENLYRLGYRVDTSIAAYTDWGEYGGPDFSVVSPGAFRFRHGDIINPNRNGELAEVPATVGFLQDSFSFANKLHRAIRKEPLKTFKLPGILHRLRLNNKAWLSPETSTAATMKTLADKMKKNNYSLINMAFHSPNLREGLTPFVRTKEEEKDFLLRIRGFLSFAKSEGIGSITLSEAVRYI